eukprot:1544925-Rhodomonas_salina.1
MRASPRHMRSCLSMMSGRGGPCACDAGLSAQPPSWPSALRPAHPQHNHHGSPPPRFPLVSLLPAMMHSHAIWVVVCPDTTQKQAND